MKLANKPEETEEKATKQPEDPPASSSNQQQPKPNPAQIQESQLLLQIYEKPSHKQDKKKIGEALNDYVTNNSSVLTNSLEHLLK